VLGDVVRQPRDRGLRRVKPQNPVRILLYSRGEPLQLVRAATDPLHDHPVEKVLVFLHFVEARLRFNKGSVLHVDKDMVKTQLGTGEHDSHITFRALESIRVAADRDLCNHADDLMTPGSVLVKSLQQVEQDPDVTTRTVHKYEGLALGGEAT
jgi:hypothetical protein